MVFSVPVLYSSFSWRIIFKSAKIVLSSFLLCTIIDSSKKEKKFKGNCRAVIGVIAGGGRLDKPVVKAGKQHHIKKSKSKLWPRTGAFKMNAIDHPFGSGRAKNPKSKIAKRNAPPGRRVGLIRPRRTGKKK